MISRYFSHLLTAIFVFAFASCSKEEDVNSQGFVEAYGKVHRLDYAIADYAPHPAGFDQIFMKMSNRPLPHAPSGPSTPTWNHALELYFVSTLTSIDDYSGSYPLKNFGQLQESGELDDGELSYLTGAVLHLNMKYENGKWEGGERLFEWTDGHVEISKTSEVYLVRFSLWNKENTYTGEYRGLIAEEVL